MVKILQDYLKQAYMGTSPSLEVSGRHRGLVLLAPD